MLIGRRHRILETVATRTLVTQSIWQDVAAAEAAALAAGAHGAYVRNALAAGEGEGIVFATGAAAGGVCWFGPRGNLVVVADESGPADRIAKAVLAQQLPWRIAMGPTAVVNELRERTGGRSLVWRDQIYYTGMAATVAGELVRDDVRAAQVADRDRLLQATLQLNASDLHVDPARVDRRWLRDTIDERIAEGTTRVLGEPGALLCKLDYGSRGPGGTVVEGVFTFAEARGRGLAAALVASCIAGLPGPVHLHVGMHNAPARAAYERAGMVVAGRCRLLLLP